jgi:histidinol-phosphate aminotransferase
MDVESLLNPHVRGLEPYVPILPFEALSRRLGIPPAQITKLDANENPYPPPPEVMERIGAAAFGLQLNRYPDPEATGLRRTLAARSGWPLEGLLLGNGSDDLIVLLLTACGGAGATLVVPTPTFSMYRQSALALGWRVEEVPLTPSFALDEAALLERAAAARPRLSIFATPNNPTGNRFDTAFLERYLRTAPGIVVIDEAYHDFCGESLVPLLHRHPNLVVLQTLSKIGLAALRVGILLADARLAVEFNKVRLPYNLGSFSQVAALTALQMPEYLRSQVATILEERRRLADALARMSGVTVFPSDANFLLLRTDRPSRSLFEGLRARGVLVRDLGGAPGLLERCLRVTVGRPGENDAFLEAFAAVLGAAGAVPR